MRPNHRHRPVTEAEHQQCSDAPESPAPPGHDAGHQRFRDAPDTRPPDATARSDQGFRVPATRGAAADGVTVMSWYIPLATCERPSLAASWQERM